MDFLKFRFKELPKIIMAHNFSTDNYGFRGRMADFTEVVYIEQGEWEVAIEGYKPIIARAGDILVLPPLVSSDCNILSPGSIHTHSTIGVLGDFSIEPCTHEDILNQHVLYNPSIQNANTENMFFVPIHYTANDTSDIKQKITAMIKEYGLKTMGFELALSGLFLELTSMLTRKCIEVCDNNKWEYIPASNNIYCKKAIAFLNDNYKKHLDLNELGAYMGLNANYLCNIFKKTTGHTILNYHNRIKINKAKELIMSSELNINRICIEVGIENEQYFSRLFKKNEGISPKQFRLLCKRKINDDEMPVWDI